MIRDDSTCPEGQPPAAPGLALSGKTMPERVSLGPVTLELHPVLRTTLLIAWAALSGVSEASNAWSHSAMRASKS